MKDKRISSTSIDSAFAKDMQPVYVVSRHGYSRRFLSRSAAISNLAHYMVTKTFQRAGLNTNEPDEPVFSNGVLVNRMGQHTQQYLFAHNRCMRRIRRILERKRNMQKWLEKWDAMHDRYVKEQAELQATNQKGSADGCLLTCCFIGGDCRQRLWVVRSNPHFDEGHDGSYIRLCPGGSDPAVHLRHL